METKEALAAFIHFLQGLPEALAHVDGLVTQLLLDSQHLVVLGQPLRAAGGAGLDLSGAETDHQICDEAILGLAGTVRDHGSPAVRFGQVMGFDGLGDGADLVHLYNKKNNELSIWLI